MKLFLTTCYTIYFLLFPVAESCVTYKLEGLKTTISSWAKTVVIGKLVKRVHNWGKAELLGTKPVSFQLFQREGDFKRDHTYIFEERGVSYKIVRYGSGGNEVKEGFFESSVLLLDPFTASLMVYIDTPNFVTSTLQLFYDAKVQQVSYRTVGKERVSVFGKSYDAWKVILIPSIETKGVLKPKGRWFLWIDRETLIPVKLKLGFTIGSVSVHLKEVKGNRRLLLRIKDSFSR